MEVLDTPRHKWAIDAVGSDATPAIHDQASTLVTEERESKRRAEGDLGAIVSPEGMVEVEAVDVDVDGMNTLPNEPDIAIEVDGARDSVSVAAVVSSTVNAVEDAEAPPDGCLATEPTAHAGDGGPPLPKVEYADIVRPPPRRPGWGRHPSEHVLHTVPQSHGEPDRKRCIFRQWPRHPQGMPIVHSQLKGKQSPDGYPWGATLYDFYRVHPNPSDCREVLHMTGSALLEEMKALGEMDTAAHEIEWAESEGKPMDEGTANVEELIKGNEDLVRKLIPLRLLPLELPREGEGVGKGGEVKDDVVNHASIPPPLTIPLTSPFHPSYLPNSWPHMPFHNFAWPTLLHERIPLYLLPRRLYVHDPFNLLFAKHRLFCNKNWSSQPDIVRTYDIRFIESVGNENAEARKMAEALEEFKAHTLIVLRYKRTREQIENIEPVIEISLPRYKRRPTKIEEGHLYISPIAGVGFGHHSIVYRAEWELPRDPFVRPALCLECFKESVDKEIEKMKDTGRQEKVLDVATCGPTGFSGHEQELEEVNGASRPEQNGEIVEREIICVVLPDMAPSQALNLLDERNIWHSCIENPKNTVVVDLAQKDEDEPTDESDVAIIRINPEYESQKDCTLYHNALPVPRTTRFSVVAKLSLEGDRHLPREAKNYQQFPEHFFRHYNGYTIISQLRTIVPVHAIVPQFYGYYTPQMGDHESESSSYLSPILLLEHCGCPIDPKTLSAEDQEECISMVLRFQRGGWLHDSIAPRNFVVQEGPLTEFPSQRTIRRESSFRLIDFGRSKKYTGSAESEVVEVMEMFGRVLDHVATAGFW